MKDKPKDIRELLTAESIAAYREQVIEECAMVADGFMEKKVNIVRVNVLVKLIADAIRALNKP